MCARAVGTKAYNTRAFDAYLLAKRFFFDLCEELKYHGRSDKYLTRENQKTFEEYYNPNYTIKPNYYGNFYAQRIKDMIGLILHSPNTPRLLDAGCGLGSEAILFSLLGAKVIGVDLDEERLEVARARVAPMKRSTIPNFRSTLPSKIY